MKQKDNINLSIYIGKTDLPNRLFSRILKTFLGVVTFAFFLYGILAIIGGIVISLYYREHGQVFLSIFDIRELIAAIVLYLIGAPLMWSWYYWQPYGLQSTIQKIYEEIIVKRKPQGLKKFQDFVVSQMAGINRIFLPMIALGVTATLLLLVTPSLTSSKNPFTFGGNNIWMTLNPYYFWLIWTPLVHINTYMMIWVIIRIFFAVNLLNEIFGTYRIKPILMHPDGCNGFSSIGNFSIKTALLGVLAGLWLAFVIVFPIFFGQPANLKSDTIIMLIAYMVFIPVLLFAPAWSAHIAMSKYKQDALLQISKEIELLVIESKKESIFKNKDMLKELYERYQLLNRELRVWPFRKLAIQGFFVTYLLPLILSLIPTWLT